MPLDIPTLQKLLVACVHDWTIFHCDDSFPACNEWALPKAIFNEQKTTGTELIADLHPVSAIPISSNSARLPSRKWMTKSN